MVGAGGFLNNFVPGEDLTGVLVPGESLPRVLVPGEDLPEGLVPRAEQIPKRTYLESWSLERSSILETMSVRSASRRSSCRMPSPSWLTASFLSLHAGPPASFDVVHVEYVLWERILVLFTLLS